METHTHSSRRWEAVASAVDGKALSDDLKSKITGEVRFDEGSRALYAADASNYRYVPIGVVIPRSVEDVVETVAACRRHGAPLLSRGGGTGLSGQTCNTAVVMDVSKYLHHILDLDPQAKIAHVEPGTVLDDLRDAAERHHLTFGPDPATHRWCTLGGMIGNDSCGVHSLMSGKTVDNVEELEILTYDGVRMRVGPTSEDELERIIGEGGRRGQIYAGLKAIRDRYGDQVRARYPRIPRRVSGYNLDQLLPENGFNVARALVGTEGTCVVVLEAKLQLIYSPPARSLVVLGYPDVFRACDDVPLILEFKPVGLEGFDDLLVRSEWKKRLHTEALAQLPVGQGWAMVEFGAETREEASARANELMAALRKQASPPDMRCFDNPAHEKAIWEVREAALGATSRTPGEPDLWPGWEDSAVPPDKLGGYLRDLRDLFHKYDYEGAFYGHFGQGCIHVRLNFDLVTAEGIRKYVSFAKEAAELVVCYGGVPSGEHGDGQSRAELLPIVFGEELVKAFGEFKSLWDPDWKMNPGKVVDPYGIGENLRFGADFEPWHPATHFQFPDDEGSLVRATQRCVGVGKCRSMAGGTMCPSYRVLREEQQTTRGRTHLMFEMLRGDALRGGWHEESVREALEYCLSCKGCKGDCPVRVDVATYKAEFLSHYYAGRPRPRSGYAFGLLPFWVPLAARMPGLANLLTQAFMLRDLAKASIGMPHERQIPPLAPQTFKAWFRQRGSRGSGSPVILWPDTFNNYFLPDTAKAAVEVLEGIGCQVIVPQQNLCCGRPLYDYGWLDQAKGLLRQVMTALRSEIREGVPIVGLEPSCIATFRDELPNLFPQDEDARRLSQQSFLLSEYLMQQAKDYPLPQLHRKAIVHGHCHHKAIMSMAAEGQLLSRLGIDYSILDSGCCGMAGAFGFEAAHYDVSIKAGEHVLLPAVRGAAKDTLIIADGFSCREQIAQTTSRRAIHLAHALQMAMREGPDGPAGEYPESTYLQSVEGTPNADWLKMAALGAASLGAAGFAWWRSRESR